VNAFVVTFRAEYEIPGVDRLKVNGDLVEIQRAGGSAGEYETVAVVGSRDLQLVSLGEESKRLPSTSVGNGQHRKPRVAAKEPIAFEPW
jgi:hypothetical protein